MNNKDIIFFSLEELSLAIQDLGEPKFRAKQVYEWLHSKHVDSYDLMLNIPKSLRNKLQDSYPLNSARVINKLISKDESRKYLVEYNDGVQVEVLALPNNFGNDSNDRLCVCFSTQAGCSIDCDFCATGKQGLTRNLSAQEMYDQVRIVQNDFDIRISSLVAMGQGEPFLNYQNVLKAIRLFNQKDDFNIGARHITISTCGILNGITKFANEDLQLTLAISLHSAIQKDRDIIMPKLKSMNLDLLKQELLEYVAKTNRRVSLEYLMIKNTNDTEKHLEALKGFCSGLLCHVNLLPLNSILESIYYPSSKTNIEIWKKELNNKGIETTIRTSRGEDIQGACGQLKNFYSSK